jgi:hypothetical protein
LGESNFIVLGVNLDEDGAFLDPLIVIDIDPYDVAGNSRADGREMNIRLGSSVDS